MVVAPKEAKATSGEPTVEVLGATLRLDGKSGYQSMRVGIKVTNASKAKACGINLKVGDKSVVVSTEKSEYQKIYDETVSRNEMHEMEQEKQWNRGRGR